MNCKSTNCLSSNALSLTALAVSTCSQALVSPLLYTSLRFGRLQLASLSCAPCRHFSTEVAAYDIQTRRCDVYGQGEGYRDRVMLIYDGLHYDALALAGTRHFLRSATDCMRLQRVTRSCMLEKGQPDPSHLGCMGLGKTM